MVESQFFEAGVQGIRIELLWPAGSLSPGRGIIFVHRTAATRHAVLSEGQSATLPGLSVQVEAFRLFEIVKGRKSST